VEIESDQLEGSRSGFFGFAFIPAELTEQLLIFPMPLCFNWLYRNCPSSGFSAIVYRGKFCSKFCPFKNKQMNHQEILEVKIYKPGIMIHTCNPSTQEPEAGGFPV
jgi:hypothetical protein